MRTKRNSRTAAIRRGTSKAVAAVLVVLLVPFASLSGAAALAAEPADFTLAESIAVDGEAPDMAFPRLMTYWPLANTQEQIEANARYDILALNRGTENAQYRALNSDIILLKYIAAGDLAVDPWVGSDAYPNYIIAATSPRWITTQVGSELAVAVDADDTVLRVRATTLDGTQLFSPSDTLVVGDELMLVEAVGSDTITVRRGVASEKISHPAGERVASAFSTWDETVLMDVTTDCPAVTVDPAVGPETYAQWFARRTQTYLDDADWDGIFLDTCEGAKSWAVYNGMNHSIDGDRDNVADTLPGFDADWLAGMIGLEDELREDLGDKFILGNNSVPNYQAVNGANLEAFPRGDTTYEDWDREVIDSQRDRKSAYFQWAENGRQPNLSTILTYELDSLMSENPLDDPTWEPNYRKMRFGLTTALLEDGFFAYQIAWNGLGDDGLMWFDEFDNAGEGQGYLGQPVGDKFQVTGEEAPVEASDLLGGDGALDSAESFGAWELEVHPGYAAEAQLEADGVRIDVGESAGTISGVNLIHQDIPTQAGQEYRLTFRAKADRPMLVLPRVIDVGPWNKLVNWGTQTFGTEWQEYDLVATATESNAGVPLLFSVSYETGTVWLDDIEITPVDGTVTGETNVWRRDYQGGITIVNPGDSVATVQLGEAFRKIDGTQDRSVNDGSLVTEVTLDAHDGIVLLREGAIVDPPADDPPADDPPADDPPADDPPADDPTADDGADYTTIAGDDRYETSALVSRESFPNGADTVVIATGLNWPDALGGGALAGAYSAPILLTKKDALPAVVAAEIERLGATEAIVLGGVSVVSKDVVADLRDIGITRVRRLGGSDRYWTAQLVAEATIDRLGGDWDGAALVATGLDFPDALAAAPLAASTGLPLYLAKPGASADELAADMAAAGVTDAIVLGGTASVARSYETALRSRVGVVTRLAGANRYATAAAIGDYATTYGGLDWASVCVSTGENYPDALSGGVLAARAGSVLVLTRRSELPRESSTVLAGNSGDISDVVFLGGRGAVGSDVRTAIESILD